MVPTVFFPLPILVMLSNLDMLPPETIGHLKHSNTVFWFSELFVSLSWVLFHMLPLWQATAAAVCHNLTPTRDMYIRFWKGYMKETVANTIIPPTKLPRNHRLGLTKSRLVRGFAPLLLTKMPLRKHNLTARNLRLFRLLAPNCVTTYSALRTSVAINPYWWSSRHLTSRIRDVPLRIAEFSRNDLTWSKIYGRPSRQCAANFQK